MPGHWWGPPRKTTSIQKASDQRRWLTRPAMLMAGELSSGVCTASDWDKPTHLACTVRRT